MNDFAISNTMRVMNPRNTIRIMRDVFDAAQLIDLVECLEADGHRCSLFDGPAQIHNALTDPETVLLILGATESTLPVLVEAVKVDSGHVNNIPVLVYFKQCLRENCEEMLAPEIDDFILDPLNLESVRWRVQRLIQQFSERLDEKEQVKMNLLSHFGMRQFVGKAPSFLAAIEKIPRVASCDASVLLVGETGTGKEMCARAIHYLSPRAGKPFIPVNCGSIPAELFENEMFGHEAGAYTDARQARRGLIAEAEGGTLFLDEVDSLPLSAQIKLLRFLQDKQYRPLGATGFRQANTRILAATNRNLQSKLRSGEFREDLYYRLKIVSLTLPALRDRQEDTVPLATHFMKTAAREYNRPITRFTPDAIKKLATHPWPGNVRELENVVRQGVVLADGPALRAQDLQLAADYQSSVPPGREPFKVAKARVIEAFERSYLSDLISDCHGNISRAAREAHKDRRAFFALLKKYGLTSLPLNGPRGEELNRAAALGA